MTRLLLSIVLAVTLAGSAAAQTSWTVTVTWDPNVASDNVTRYDVYLDGTQAATLVDLSQCTTSCAARITLTALGSHTVSVTATNQFGTSDPASVTFVANKPGQVKNVKVR